jgi:diacylglycerol kinase (ATP)
VSPTRVPSVRTHSIIWSFQYAIEGVVYAIRTQRNMRIHVGAAIGALVTALLLGIDRLGLVAIVFVIALVFVTELVNTAVEATVDIATQQYEPLAKIAKDVAAGAVLIASLTALVVAYLVMFERLKDVVASGLDFARLAAPDVAVIALGLTLLAVLIAKAVAREKNYLRGGWPSGHTALAFGIAVTIGFMTNSPAATLLALFGAFLVAQSRVEGNIHTVPQVILGALLGILLPVAVYQLFLR